MRVVITGATGNVGTSVVAALEREPRVTEIVGLARRRSAAVGGRTRWVAADITTAPPEPAAGSATRARAPRPRARAHDRELAPAPPADAAGWLDMGLQTPIMDVSRARTELGWEPRRSAGEALLEGMREGAGAPTPPLDPGTTGPLRLREFLTGVGRR